MKFAAFLKKYWWLTAILGFAILFGILLILPSDENLLVGSLIRLGGGAVLFLMTYFIMDKSYAGFPKGGIWKDSFKFGRGILISALMSFALTLVAAIMTQNALADNWFLMLLAYALLTFAVGVLEECAFRGVIFNSLLDGKLSPMWAAVISSFLFGLIHVISQFSMDYMTILTCVVKLIQTFATGFVWCAMAYKFKNIWITIVSHALNDFLLFIGQLWSSGESSLGSYAIDSSRASFGWMSIVFQLTIVLILVPSVVRSFKALKAPTVSAEG